MAVTEALAPTATSSSSPPKQTPFSAAKEAAAAASAAMGDVSPSTTASGDVQQQSALVVRAPGSSKQQQQCQQEQEGAKSQVVLVRKVSFSKKLLACACVRPAVIEEDECFDAAAGRTSSLASSSNTSSLSDVVGHRSRGLPWESSPRKCVPLNKQSSTAFTDADWYDARSEFSSVLSLHSQASDQAAKLEELSLMIRDLAPAPPHKAPWIPEPALAFGHPGMRFVPVPAFTGFAAYWERNRARSTAHPTPIDKMTKASALAQRSHESIPGIWLQETDTHFSVTVKPAFLPPGLPRYTETYDKTHATEYSWTGRRDLRLGSTSGQIFMTTDGTLILRARSRPMFGSVDYVMEEYMSLEEGGEVIKDRMCCLEIKSGNRATQIVVGHRHAVPPRGHV